MLDDELLEEDDDEAEEDEEDETAAFDDDAGALCAEAGCGSLLQAHSISASAADKIKTNIFFISVTPIL